MTENKVCTAPAGVVRGCLAKGKVLGGVRSRGGDGHHESRLLGKETQGGLKKAQTVLLIARLPDPTSLHPAAGSVSDVGLRVRLPLPGQGPYWSQSHLQSVFLSTWMK